MKANEQILQEYNIEARQLAATQPVNLGSRLFDLEQAIVKKSDLYGAELKELRSQIESLRWQILSTWHSRRAA